MKNYYYFLGVDEKATDDEIKIAYRKLSFKYHPDQNNHDTFFSNRFRKVREAYEILSNKEKRKIFDQHLSNFRRNNTLHLSPKISHFSVNKTRINNGEELTIYWKTLNADLVKILPFGLVKPEGEKSISIEQFNENGHFQIILTATNSITQKSVAQSIMVHQISKVEKPKAPVIPQKENHSKPQNKNLFFNFTIFLIILVIIILIFIFLI